MIFNNTHCQYLTKVNLHENSRFNGQRANIWDDAYYAK